MNPERLLRHFDQIAEAPDAVPRLRRFILDLAVRGKLVEQNPEDKSASELLKRIEKENKKSEAITSFSADIDPPFEIPNSWVWAQIGSIAYVEMGQSPPSEHYNQSGEGLPFYQGKADFGKRNPMPRYWCSQPTKLAKKNDILISVRAPVGPTNVASEECCIGRGLAAIRPHKGVDLELFLYWLKGFEQKIAEMGFGTTFIAINKKQLVSFPLPLPPLAEQHWIVAKVDQLMALCDELEAAQAKREKRRGRLVAATLHGLNNGDESGEHGIRPTFEESARFYFNHLPRLTTRHEHIQQLRQTILNLAVRGKLVPQDPKDGHASELLRRVQEEKERLAAEGKYRGDIKVQPLRADNVPSKIPPSWVWVRFGSIIILRDGERIPISKDERNLRPKIYDYYGASGVIDKIDGFLFEKPLLLIGEDGANLINRSTPIAFIARGKYWVNNHAHVIDGISEKFLRYMELFINATDLKPYVTGTAQPKMNQAKMNSIPVALPPLAEQDRIVERVDNLMALCNELESRLTKTATTRRQLLDAALYEALNLHSEIR